MKKYILLIANILILTSLFAQKASLTKAYNFFYDKDYDKAKEQIDLCAADEKLSAKAQTWLYKGNIEFLLANREYSEKQKNESYQIRYPNAPEEAFDAFEKAIAINPKVEALDMMSAQEALKQLYPYLLVRGVDQLIAKDFSGAKTTLAKGIKSYEMDTPQYPMNGDLYYYYAYALESLGETSEMMKYYQKALRKKECKLDPLPIEDTGITDVDFSDIEALSDAYTHKMAKMKGRKTFLYITKFILFKGTYLCASGVWGYVSFEMIWGLFGGGI